jgi:hypothetical protein
VSAYPWWPGELLLEVSLLDILDDIPVDMEMTSHIKDRHALRELEDVPFSKARV